MRYRNYKNELFPGTETAQRVSRGGGVYCRRLVVLLLAVTFPVALLFAWAFEMTPEGIKLEKHVDRTAHRAQTGFYDYCCESLC